jgi:hypothetical protein
VPLFVSFAQISKGGNGPHGLNLDVDHWRTQEDAGQMEDASSSYSERLHFLPLTRVVRHDFLERDRLTF